MNESNLDKRRFVKIYYDGDCGFCFRGVHLLRKFLLVKDCEIISGQTDSDIYKIMQAEDSWVVTNKNGDNYTGFMAGVELAKYSPIFKWFTPLARFKFVQKIGEKFYRYVAKNRAKIWLPK
ncbi:DUF393 domain-containing protein [Candidatus Kaiserbacteria bacterium]|nr:DUF393 domain-containing protein [Candidatus Kaiserbacteria bacterium]